MSTTYQKALHAAFAKAHKAGDLPAAVQLARQAIAPEVLRGALDDDAGTYITLLRGEREHQILGGQAWDEQCADVFAALAAGVALGQLVSPDVFGAKPYQWKCDDPAVTKKAGAR